MTNQRRHSIRDLPESIPLRLFKYLYYYQSLSKMSDSRALRLIKMIESQRFLGLMSHIQDFHLIAVVENLCNPRTLDLALWKALLDFPDLQISDEAIDYFMGSYSFDAASFSEATGLPYEFCAAFSKYYYILL